MTTTDVLMEYYKDVARIGTRRECVREILRMPSAQREEFIADAEAVTGMEVTDRRTELKKKPEFAAGRIPKCS